MMRVEEMQAIRATPGQAIDTLLDVARMKEWNAPDVTVVARTAAKRLMPGDRFRVETIAGPGFEYQVEAVTGRDVVLRFEGPWSGEERWSFVADGEETIVRRTYTVGDLGGLAGIAWRVLGQAIVLAHFKLELARFRSLVERLPRIRAEIDAGGPERASAELGDPATGARESAGPEVSARRFHIDEG